MNKLLKENRIVARRKWHSELSGVRLNGLDLLSQQYRFSVALGDLIFLDGKWYVTNSGLLRLAHRSHCCGIRSEQVREFCEVSSHRWVFRAIVYKSTRSRGFVGYGDADPSNTSPLVRGAELRVAETRAVNRALRKAYAVALCSVEELGSFSAPQKPITTTSHSNGHPGSNGSSNGQPRLRDQLCVLIRQHNLDPSLVKAYAADFCGTATLKEASRDLVETFVSTLADEAAKDRAALVCKLNSYTPRPEEVNS